jgi:hypothetical protein
MQMKRTCDAEPVPVIAAHVNLIIRGNSTIKSARNDEHSPVSTLNDSARPPTPVPSADFQTQTPPKCTVPTPYCE